jgi:hypothetical protein
MVAKSAREVHEALKSASQAHLDLTKGASALEAELSLVLFEDEAEAAQQTQSLRACLGALREGKKVDIKAAMRTVEDSNAFVQRHDRRSLSASLQNLSALLRTLLQQMKSVQRSWEDRGDFLSHEPKLANLKGFIQSLEAAELAEDFKSKCQNCIEDLLPLLEVI